MDAFQVGEIIDRHIKKHQDYLDETYSIGDSNDDIGFHNTVIGLLQKIKKEVKIYYMVEGFNNPFDAIDLLEEVNVDEEFVELMNKLITED